jgi:hypothetical protein
LRRLRSGQASGLAEPISAGPEAVSAPDRGHDLRAEGNASPRFQPSLIEDGCDFFFRVLIEKVIDGPDDLGRGTAKLKGIDRPRQLQRASWATPEADVSLNQVASDQSDVLNEEPQQTLFLSDGGAQILPETRKVEGQAEYFGTLLLTQLRSIIGWLFEVSRGFGQQTKFLIPFRLQIVGDQAVSRVNLHEAIPSDLRLIASPLYALRLEPLCFVNATGDFRMDFERQFQGQRRNHFQQESTDGLVNTIAAYILTLWSRFGRTDVTGD